MKVLIVEDEPSLREIIRKALQNERLVVEEGADFATACEKTGLYDC